MKRISLLALLIVLITGSCKKDKAPLLVPTVTTAALTNITTTSATSGGAIASDGGAAITASGIVLSKYHTTPTLADTVISGSATSGSFTTNLTNLDFGTTYYIRAYATNSAGTGYGDVVTLNTTNDDTKVRFTYKGQGVIYGVITSPTTGRKWMDRDLGASQAATSNTDVLAYGDLFQWGRLADGHQIRTSGTTTIASTTDVPGHGNFIIWTSPSTDWKLSKNDNLWQGSSGINNPCPAGWHIPTKAEWQAETGLTDVNTSYSQLKLALGGYRYGGDATLKVIGVDGSHWSSTPDPSNTTAWFFLNRTSPFFGMAVSDRASGYLVRCIKD